MKRYIQQYNNWIKKIFTLVLPAEIPVHFFFVLQKRNTHTHTHDNKRTTRRDKSLLFLILLYCVVQQMYIFRVKSCVDSSVCNCCNNSSQLTWKIWMGFKSNWKRFWTERVTKDKKLVVFLLCMLILMEEEKKCKNTKMEHKTNENKENKGKDI